MKNVTKVKKENGFVKFVRIILIVILLPVVLIYSIFNMIKTAKIKKLNREKVKVYEVSQIDQLTGIEFEVLLKELFEKMGYNVSLTKKSYDFGADLVISKKGKSSIVQAKCFAGTVGAKAIQEVVAAKKHYKTEDALAVTNRKFSKEAETLALENNVKLIERDMLMQLVKKYDIHIDKTKNNFQVITKKAVAEIESKYRYWI